MHELHIAASGKVSMAYATKNGIPWHTLGHGKLNPEDFDSWEDDAGFNFKILQAQVYFKSDGLAHSFPKRFVLYRSDTQAPISIMSDRYRIVQPKDIMEFFRDVCTYQGWLVETAGVMKEGAQYWCMARTPESFTLGNSDQHVLFILLVTSVDGSLPTTGIGTDVRGVCANTIRLALQTGSGKVVTKHNTDFDADRVKKELGMIDYSKSWSSFQEKLRLLSDVPISAADATAFFSNLLRPPKERKSVVEQEQLAAQDFSGLLSGRVKAGAVSAQIVERDSNRAIRGLAELETSYYTAPGACPGTLYGVLQGVTHFLDHSRGSDANRLSSAWFGQGAALKEQAFSQLLERASATA